jgi:hypothetical protein
MFKPRMIFNILYTHYERLNYNTAYFNVILHTTLGKRKKDFFTAQYSDDNHEA